MTRNNRRKGYFAIPILLALYASNAPAQTVTITNLDVKENIVVSFHVDVKGRSAITAVCGHGSSEQILLCAGVSRLEMKVEGEWVRTRPHFEGGVLGGIGTNHDTFARLDSAPGSDVQFAFSKQFFGLRKGALLRVAMDVWNNEESFHKGEAPSTAWSQPFSCP
jgi:hypothetical protein